MAAATIQFNEQQKRAVDELLSNIKNGSARAQRTALNRTLTGTVALISKEMRNVATLKASKIKDNIVQYKAQLSNLSAKAVIRGRPIPAINYQNRQLKKGISIKVFKSEGTTQLKHAFYAKIGGRSPGIFMRKKLASGRYVGRLPIVEQFGPSLTTIYEKTPGLSEKIEATAAERLQAELAHQIDYLLGLNNDGPD